MGNHAYFMDGQTATRHDVSLSLGAGLLLIHGADGECLASWTIKSIYPVEKITPSRPFLLTSSDMPLARLRIDEAATKDWITNALPGLSQRTDHRKETRLAWGLSAAAVVVCVGLYFLFPIMGQVAATYVPVDWEKDYFEGSAKNAARAMGAKAYCMDPAGQAILSESVARLWPGGQAPQVRVVKHKMVNAFAAPGYEVFILSGLIEKAESPSEVMGVLAHELGHVKERHPIQGVVQGMGVSLLSALLSGGTLTDVAGLLAQTSYSRDQEREADRFALDRLKANNIRATGLADFFDRLGTENRTLERYMALVSTHPLSEERAALIRAQKGGGPAMSDAKWKKLRGICKRTEPIE